MRELFDGLVERALARLQSGEFLLANFNGEISDFVRFNRARVRQAMTVRQAYLALTLVAGKRHATARFTVAGDPEQDNPAVDQALARLRADLPGLPEDPYLLYSTRVESSENTRTGRLPAAGEAIDAIVEAARGSDLVGILASGPTYHGFANAAGQRNWHAVESFNFDWSLYHAQDKAVKASFAGTQWSAAELQQRLSAAREQLQDLARPAKTITPGAYRTYLAPAAMDELLGLLNWGGVSEKARRTRTSPLQRLADREATLSERVFLRERTGAGLAPAFDSAGFVRPASVDLISAGRDAGALVSPRTAAEYGIAANGADDEEHMQSIDLAGGTLATQDALAGVDTGVYVGNLWYLNYSDRPNCRITGMTRFGTFWVESGRIVAPLSVMRFDDSLFRILGPHLVDLTREQDWIVSASSYDQRSIETSRVPGVLLSALNFTL